LPLLIANDYQLRIPGSSVVDLVHLMLTTVALLTLALCALAQRFGPGRPLIGNFAAVSTVVAVLGFGLMARDCLRSGSCAPAPQYSAQAAPNGAARLAPAAPGR
jgi:hypothetical protein